MDRYHAVLATLTKSICSKSDSLSLKIETVFLYFQFFSSKTSSGSVEDSLTALLGVFGSNLLKNFNLIEFVRKLFSQMVQL